MIGEGLLARIESFGGDPSATAIGAGLLVTECIEPALDVATLDAALGALIDANTGAVPPWMYLGHAGFRGVPELDVIEGSRIDRLVENRCGLPITLGALLIHVAEHQGCSASGINFPGHFLVRVDGAIVDPFLMVECDEADCLAGLPAALREEDPFVQASPPMMLLRMLNNVKFHHMGRDEFHLALDMVDCQLRLLPGEAGLLFEQGECWLRIGSVEAAGELTWRRRRQRQGRATSMWHQRPGRELMPLPVAVTSYTDSAVPHVTPGVSLVRDTGWPKPGI